MELFRTNLHLLEDQQVGSLSSGQQEVVGLQSPPAPAPQPGQQQQFVSPACSVLPSNLNNNSLHYQHHGQFPGQAQAQAQASQILKQYQVFTTAPIPQPTPAPAPAPMVISKLKASPTLISLQSARDHKFMPY